LKRGEIKKYERASLYDGGRGCEVSEAQSTNNLQTFEKEKWYSGPQNRRLLEVYRKGSRSMGRGEEITVLTLFFDSGDKFNKNFKNVLTFPFNYAYTENVYGVEHGI
jgi:hypothetical protein